MIFGSIIYTESISQLQQSSKTDSGLLKGCWLALAEVQADEAFTTGRQLLEKAAAGSLKT